METKKKYFIAIVPPEKILNKVEMIKQQLFTDHHLKGALRTPAHITLHRPFEWKEEKENELINALNEFRFNGTFNIELKNYNCFQPRVIYVDVIKSEELNNLHLKLRGYARRELNLLNEDEDLRGFCPHMTIASRDLKKQLFYKLWDSFKIAEFHENFDFSGFSLLKLDSKWEITRNFNI
jgi:2'-5' RNA ligase